MPGPFASLWSSLEDALFTRRPGPPPAAQAPVIWLLGKTGAGKTAIIAALTGDSRAEIGRGYAPCTRSARLYDVPEDAPLLRFLDTRGLGEARYDPAEDIAFAESQSHLVLAVMQAADPDQAALLSVLREVRRRHPEWPVLAAQTGLHRLYPPGAAHAEPWDEAAAPEALRRALAAQRAAFAGLADGFVPLDFTQGTHQPALYRLEALRAAIAQHGGEVAARLRGLGTDEGQDRLRARARRTVNGYAALAGGTGAVPIPIAGIGGLVAMQGLMLRSLAARFGVEWTRRDFAEFAGMVGAGALGGFALRYGATELLKLVPFGGTLAAGAVNAAAAAALTKAMGEAAIAFLAHRRLGAAVPAGTVRAAFAEALQGAWAR
ncbi:GTPase family protein [Roseococcus sp. DSY-14]|uniref:GTPase family protein n=1 Tax=Roseococcus sp. DSY-14 TaxID=3369650 RepID=UPI00387AD115